MEIKEALEIIKQTSIVYTSTEIGQKYNEALQTAISHLETLQKVKEAGGVKKEKIPEIKQNFQSLFPEEIGLLLHQRSKIIGYNEALVLKDAELAGKLAGLEGIVKNWVGSSASENKLIQAIQELILGKKEG